MTIISTSLKYSLPEEQVPNCLAPERDLKILKIINMQNKNERQSFQLAEL